MSVVYMHQPTDVIYDSSLSQSPFIPISLLLYNWPRHINRPRPISRNKVTL